MLHSSFHSLWLSLEKCAWRSSQSDAPPSSLMDSIVSPKMKTLEGEGVGAHSLSCNALGVEGCVQAPKWD
jgi:hypothetical protein